MWQFINLSAKAQGGVNEKAERMEVPEDAEECWEGNTSFRHAMAIIMLINLNSCGYLYKTSTR